MIGATYNLRPALTLFGSYSEANAAPTPAELSFASPEDSFSLANFMSGGPDLKQIVVRTFEAGFRSATLGPASSIFSYNADFYHSVTNDDIEFLQSLYNPIGSGYFGNVGNVYRRAEGPRSATREGLDRDPRWWTCRTSLCSSSGWQKPA
jgi:outer membrane receptor protein involved in Fe transport